MANDMKADLYENERNKRGLLRNCMNNVTSPFMLFSLKSALILNVTLLYKIVVYSVIEHIKANIYTISRHTRPATGASASAQPSECRTKVWWPHLDTTSR